MSKHSVVIVATVLALALGGYWSVRRLWSPTPPPILLSESIRRGDVAAIQRYLASGGNPDAEVEINGRRMTLLKEAILDRETAIAIELLDAGADFAGSGVTLVEVGANGMTELVDRLLPLVALGNPAVTGVGNAAGHGYFDTVQSYVRFTEGRSTDDSARAFGNAANEAMLGGYDDVARALIDAGARAPDLLHTAARFSSPGMVRYLLANGADPTSVVEPPVAVVRERTPLDFAWKSYKDRLAAEKETGTSDTEYLRSRDAEYVLFELLRAGARTSDPVMHSVARDGLAEIREAPAEAQLTLAARLGFIDIAADLLRERSWSTAALREAVVAALSSDHDDIARLLLDHGAPVDGKVLPIAANASSPGLVRDLLRKGADPAELVDGKTAAEWWLNGSTQDPGFVLHELIGGGADVCWLRSNETALQGFSAAILRDSAPHCWDDAESRADGGR